MRMLPVLLASGMAVCLALIAAVLLLRGAEERDLASRLRVVLRPSAQAGGETARQATRSVFAMIAGPFRWLGEVLRARAMLTERDLVELKQAVVAAGFDGERAVPTLIGIKMTLLLGSPLAAYGWAHAAGYDLLQTTLLLAASVFVGMMLPNRALGTLRNSFQATLRRGLPDALDLMVVCAEAGLGMESVLERVAREMALTNRALANEFNLLGQEMRMLPDRRVALQHLGDRTGVEGFRRLGSTLAQTLAYGTPLAQALRMLASEMRQERMLRIEEKAVRLPTLLILPLILFIMPSLFIALVVPSILDVGAILGARR